MNGMSLVEELEERKTIQGWNIGNGAIDHETTSERLWKKFREWRNDTFVLS